MGMLVSVGRGEARRGEASGEVGWSELDSGESHSPDRSLPLLEPLSPAAVATGVQLLFTDWRGMPRDRGKERERKREKEREREGKREREREREREKYSSLLV